MRNTIKLISIILTLITVLIFVQGCNNSPNNGKSNSDNDVKEAAVQIPENNNDSSIDAEIVGTDSNDTDPNSSSRSDISGLGVTIDGSTISWANMKIDNPNLNLSENQLKVLKYFDQDYFDMYDYDSLQRYPDIYKGAQIGFPGFIIKTLDINDDNFKYLVWFSDSGSQLWVDKHTIEPDNNNFLVVSGKFNGYKRIIEGDWLYFYGRYIDIEPHEIDGSKNYYPTVTVNKYVEYSHVGQGTQYDLNYVETVAKTIFGDDLKMKQPVCGKDYNLDRLHNAQYSFYYVIPDNQTNSSFSKFEISLENGFIRSADSTEERECTFRVSADFKHYILTTFDRNLSLMYLEYYDRSFKKLWGREFKNVDNAVLDYTTKNIYLVADNDLYSMDTKSGEDIFDPVMVGEKVKLNILEDGIIMIGKGNKDNVMKTDLSGKILWKQSVDISTTECDIVQMVNGNVIAELICRERDDTHYKFEKRIVSVDTKGEILSEFKSYDDFNSYE
ncbi:MAG: hypothetical protein K6F76_04225 [Clostridiales bacterium]|nr:hypothetical protein [Clostridiales bacterium]